MRWRLLGAIVLLTWSAVGQHVDSRNLVAGKPAAPEGGFLYFVNTTSDTVVANACANGQANCSLRGAIQVANSHPGVDGIDIDLPAGSVINLTGALPNITEGVSIAGLGPNAVTVRRNTSGNYRIFTITAATGVVTLSGMTISNGLAFVDGGGGVKNEGGGTVNVTGATLSANFAHIGGGGVVNASSGTVNITNSTLSGNSSGRGGGIANEGTGAVNVNSCMLTNNSTGGHGGGIYLQNGITNVVNCTLSANSADEGGGIGAVGGTLNLSNSTLGGNAANSGGGMFKSTGTMNVRSSIIALNIAIGSSPDVQGTVVTGGFNLIGKSNGSTGFTAPTDQMGTVAAPLDPKLGALQNNGGPTQSIALLAGSPAIDKGTSSGLTGNLTTDQRGAGFPRKVEDPGVANAAGSDGTDVGAFEGQTVSSVLANISTRLAVQTGDNVLIGGFIVTGTQPKKVIVRALGPSINVAGVPVPGRLGDTTLELIGPGGTIATNDDWRTTQQAEIIASTVPPPNDLESAVVATLPANTTAYTAIVRGAGNTSGVGQVEVYDLERTVDSQLANISTRGFVQTADNVMIGGIILVGNAPRRVIVRAIGPSLSSNGMPVSGRLADPTLELRDGAGTLVASNDNWRTTQEAEIIATTVPPTNDLESAIVATLPAAPHTAIVRGKNGTSGIALVEAFALN